MSYSLFPTPAGRTTLPEEFAHQDVESRANRTCREKSPDDEALTTVHGFRDAPPDPATHRMWASYQVRDCRLLLASPPCLAAHDPAYFQKAPEMIDRPPVPMPLGSNRCLLRHRYCSLKGPARVLSMPNVR